VEQDVSYPLRERCPAWLPGEKDLASADAEALGEAGSLNGLSGSLSALEGEEETAHRYI